MAGLDRPVVTQSGNRGGEATRGLAVSELSFW
jgi:hypothetical protein